MNPKAKGEKTLAVVIAEFIKRDYVVLLPFGDNQRFDLALYLDGKFVRVQVKTAHLSNSGDGFNFATASVRTNTKKHIRSNYRGQVDYFAVYCPNIEKVYLVPVDNVGVSNATLRLKAAKSGVNSYLQAKDYELDAVKI